MTWNSFKTALKLAASKIWTLIKPVITLLLSSVVSQALPMALEIVESLATKDLTNTEKRNEAFKQISDKLAEDGHTLTTSVINLVIECAVQALKAKVK
jgi:hypothetical protein